MTLDSARQPLAVVETCPECGALLVARRNPGNGSRFLACASWCGHREPFDLRVQRLAERILFLEAELAAVCRQRGAA